MTLSNVILLQVNLWVTSDPSDYSPSSYSSYWPPPDSFRVPTTPRSSNHTSSSSVLWHHCPRRISVFSCSLFSATCLQLTIPIFLSLCFPSGLGYFLLVIFCVSWLGIFPWCFLHQPSVVDVPNHMLLFFIMCSLSARLPAVCCNPDSTFLTYTVHTPILCRLLCYASTLEIV